MNEYENEHWVPSTWEIVPYVAGPRLSDAEAAAWRQREAEREAERDEEAVRQVVRERHCSRTAAMLRLGHIR